MYTAKQYTVMLNYDGATTGNTQKSITVTYNQPIGELPTPTKDGYEFSGWFLNNKKVESTEIWTADSAVTLVAQWKRTAVATEGLAYELSSDEKSYIVTGIGTATETDIVIPSTYNDKPITSIGDSAFRVCRSLTSITIPDSVTSIGEYTFDYCNNITTVTMPTLAISYIPKTKLQTVVLTSGESIGNSAFSGCSSLASVTIGNSVTSIDKSAFYGCIGLTSATIGNSITSIGDYAFYGCSSLTSISIPDSVTSIGNRAFAYCAGFRSIIVPKSVTSIGSSAFACCYRLIEVYNKSSLTITEGSSDNGSVGYYAKNVYTPTEGASKLTTDENGFVIYDGNTLVGYVGKATEIKIPSGITVIHQYAFYGLGNLTKVIIPDSVISIGDCAFNLCEGFTSITIPQSVTSIGDGALSAGGSLISIEVAEENTNYFVDGNCLIEVGSKKLIFGCNNSVIPSNGSVTSIGEYAFMDCRSLASISIPNSVTSIGDWAFCSCGSLTSIIVPDSVTSIGDYLFGFCSSLTSITIGNSVTNIGDSAFHGCGSLKTVYYKGTTEDWAKISIYDGFDYSNYCLTNATRYYYSENEPTESGNYWHYDIDGKTPVVWVKQENN